MGSLMKDAEQAMGNEGSNQSGGQSTAEQAMGGGGGGSGGGNAMDKEANQGIYHLTLLQKTHRAPLTLDLTYRRGK